MKKSIDSSKKKITEFEPKFKEEHEAKLRLAAELENQRKRFAGEREQIIKFANRDLLEKIFPIFDNFYRSAAHAPEISIEDIPNLSEEDFRKIFNYFTGLKLIEKQLEQVLGEAGLKRIATTDQPFDHNLHEAISHEPSIEIPADHIIAEVEAGWTIDDTVIKPAKVRVSKG